MFIQPECLNKPPQSVIAEGSKRQSEQPKWREKWDRLFSFSLLGTLIPLLPLSALPRGGGGGAGGLLDRPAPLNQICSGCMNPSAAARRGEEKT